MAVRNNVPGRDEEILNRFEEPAWNNPVMRFLDARGKDIIPRRDRIWSTGAVAARLVEALEAAGREVPQYLRLAAAEAAPREQDQATFAMHCFWEGEARLGGLEGVTATRAGWIDEREVVDLSFDSAVISYEALLKAALELECASTVFVRDEEQRKTAERLAPGRVEPLETPLKDAKKSDCKYALRQTPLRFLPLTPMQAARVNAALRAGDRADCWLSPRQLELEQRIAGILAGNESALNGFEPPENVGRLADYNTLLMKRLESLGVNQDGGKDRNRGK